MKRVVGVAALCLAAVSAGTAAAATPLYSQVATRTCLARTAPVGPVKPTDSRLRSFRDLAQHNSLQVRTKSGVVALAFFKTASEAKFFVELLTVPKDRYRIQTRANVVLMYKRTAPRAFAAAVACLR